MCWVCDGSPEFTLEETNHALKRGNWNYLAHRRWFYWVFLEDFRIEELLRKYNRFMPIPIKFGTKQEPLPRPENAPDDYKTEYVTVDIIVNNPNPAWTNSQLIWKMRLWRRSSRNSIQCSSDEPLFYIHLNVDYPFTFTGILYFPKLTNTCSCRKTAYSCIKTKYLLPITLRG